MIFEREGVWSAFYPRLKRARKQRGVERAFKAVPNVGDVHEFIPSLSELIVKVVRDPRFPKKQPEAQIAFFADSIAARGSVEPRRSRDICEQARAATRNVGQIVRYEFYVECSCGYAGPAVNDCCATCGAPIVFDVFRPF